MALKAVETEDLVREVRRRTVQGSDLIERFLNRTLTVTISINSVRRRHVKPGTKQALELQSLPDEEFAYELLSRLISGEKEAFIRFTLLLADPKGERP